VSGKGKEEKETELRIAINGGKRSCERGTNRKEGKEKLRDICTKIIEGGGVCNSDGRARNSLTTGIPFKKSKGNKVTSDKKKIDAWVNYCGHVPTGKLPRKVKPREKH